MPKAAHLDPNHSRIWTLPGPASQHAPHEINRSIDLMMLSEHIVKTKKQSNNLALTKGFRV
jgi:hypothetical protein